MRQTDFAAQLPEWEEGQMAIAVMAEGRCSPLAVASDPATVRCPMCGGAEGYRVTDRSGYWWACSRQSCIERNVPAKTKMI